MKKHFYCISNIKKNIYYDLALGGKTLERALTLGARFCHRAPNARALSITNNNVLRNGLQLILAKAAH
jgi:hypothetical protein